MELIVQTTNGPVKGFVDIHPLADKSTVNEQGGGTKLPVKKWLGIPYGQAQRWTNSVPPQKWTDVKECVEFGPSPPHVPTVLGRMLAKTPGYYTRLHSGQSEETLFTVNVFAPHSAMEGSCLPVMVWIYGGGWGEGTSSLILYDATEVIRHATNDIIIVTMNYRVNLFGFLACEDLQQVDKDGLTGNYGLRDQNLALKWVHDNIFKFGGDANNVTLYGESAGACSIGYHIGGKDALFKRAILQSGAASTLQMKTVKDHNATWKLFLDYFEIKASDPKERVEAMKALSTEDLLKANATLPPQPWSACYEDDRAASAIWTIHPDARIAKGDYVETLESVMLGCCKDEGTLFAVAFGLGREDAIDQQLAQYSKHVQEAFKQLYSPPHLMEDTDLITHPISRLIADKLFNSPMLFLANTLTSTPHSKTKKLPNVYMYNSECIIEPWKALGWGIHHASDLPFTFFINSLFKEGTDEEKAAHNFVQKWTSFAATGKPNGAGQWPEYTSSNKQRVVLMHDGKDKIEDCGQQFKNEMDLWYSIIKAKAGIVTQEPTSEVEEKVVSKV